jgi:hypothetical protein
MYGVPMGNSLGTPTPHSVPGAEYARTGAGEYARGGTVGVQSYVDTGSAVAEDAVVYDSVSPIDAVPERGGVAPVPVPTPQAPAPQGDRKILRSATLDLLVADTDAAADAVRAVSDTYGGQRGTENFSQYGGEGLRRGTMVIWVPSEHFDAAVKDIKALALRVNTESVQAQDVSAQYVDLTARLKNLRATEAQYQELLSRSGSIEEVLQVTRQLSMTRQEIEQIQGQLNSLSAHVALSAITVHLTPEYAVVSPGEVVDEWRPGAVLKAAYHELQQRLIRVSNQLIVWVVVGLPLLVISLVQILFWVALVWFGVLGARRVYRRLSGEVQRDTTP